MVNPGPGVGPSEGTVQGLEANYAGLQKGRWKEAVTGNYREREHACQRVPGSLAGAEILDGGIQVGTGGLCS